MQSWDAAANVAASLYLSDKLTPFLPCFKLIYASRSYGGLTCLITQNTSKMSLPKHDTSEPLVEKSRSFKQIAFINK